MHRPDREPPGAHLPFPPMPAAWREPTTDPAGKPVPGPLPPASRSAPPPAQSPPLPPVPRSVPPPRSAPPAVHPMSPIAYPGLPMSAPPELYPSARARDRLDGSDRIDRRTGEPLSSRSSLVAGVLQIFLGGFGVGRFYTGHVLLALGQIVACWGTVLVLLCAGIALDTPLPLLLGFVPFIWPLVDGFALLAGGQHDSEGRRLRT